MIYETFREAIQNIWSNKFRTLLTMLGIIIGVMAVMVIVGLGNGMTTSIQNEFADMGTNLLTVQIMGYGSRSVKVKDFYELVEKLGCPRGCFALHQYERNGESRYGR